MRSCPERGVVPTPSTLTPILPRGRLFFGARGGRTYPAAAPDWRAPLESSGRGGGTGRRPPGGRARGRGRGPACSATCGASPPAAGTVFAREATYFVSASAGNL